MLFKIQRSMFLLSLTLVAPACAAPGDDPEDTDGPAGSTGAASSTGEPDETGEPTSTGDDSTGGEPACVEDDLAIMPFSGPGYDPDNGGLQEPLQDKYIASTTVLVLRPEQEQEFLKIAGAMLPVLTATPGLVGYSLAQSSKCGTARTLTLWRDEAAMMAFVMSDEHIAGMAKSTELSTTGTVTSWEIARAEVPIEWDAAIARATAATPSY